MIRRVVLASALVASAARAEERDPSTLIARYQDQPSAPLLLEIAAALGDSGRLAEAANSYQRYLLDPGADPARLADVKTALAALDASVAILTVYVMPRGSELSIDGGPFVAVGGSLTTRVTVGEHQVRIRNGDATSSIAVTGVAGKTKEITAHVEGVESATAPEHVDGWLIAGTPRAARTIVAAPLEAPHEETVETSAMIERAATTQVAAVAAVRIDGKLRGFAGALGLAITHGAFEAELLVLRSDRTGGYLGGRYRMERPTFRPYGALGAPAFAYDRRDAMDETSTKLAIGVRVAAGVELRVNRHLSVQADLGYEHFFSVGGTGFEPDVFVPTLGVMGSL